MIGGLLKLDDVVNSTTHAGMGSECGGTQGNELNDDGVEAVLRGGVDACGRVEKGVCGLGGAGGRRLETPGS